VYKKKEKVDSRF